MQKRRFTKQFEAEAVRLVQASGRTQREVADDLEIGLSTLVHWVGRSPDRLIDEPPKPGSEDVAAELKRLRRESEILRQERDGCDLFDSLHQKHSTSRRQASIRSCPRTWCR
jgi:transposase